MADIPTKCEEGEMTSFDVKKSMKPICAICKKEPSILSRQLQMPELSDPVLFPELLQYSQKEDKVFG